MNADTSDYRYAVDLQTGTIHRARVYRLPDDWTTDSWRHYWDGDWAAGFSVYWRVGPETYELGDSSDSERAIEAWRKAREYGDVDGSADAMKRLARRLTGWHNRGAAEFICIPLAYDRDLYVLSWDGDPEGEWRDEIEALNYGDIYRMECWQYDDVRGQWVEDDDYADEWYGRDKATAELERAFPLAEFPAELLIEDRAS